MQIRSILSLAAGLTLLAGPVAAQAPPVAAAAAPGALAEAAPSVWLNQTRTYRLWSGRAPQAAGDGADETPTITVFRPPPNEATGAAVIIAPGGAYVALAGVLEGAQPANWFTTRGVTAFILSYRVGVASRLPTPLLDGERAVRFVRAHAADFKVDPDRIGMMGFSAGGHLAATTALSAKPGDPGAADPVERVGSRPDFLILAYPWLEGAKPRPDGGSSYCDFALKFTRKACDPAAYARNQPLQLPATGAPPTFIYHTTADELVPVEGSVQLYLSLRKAGVPAELHAFEAGPHGTGLGRADPALSAWPELLQAWLRGRGLLASKPAR